MKSEQAEIITAKPSEMNILVPTDSGDFVSLLFILVVVFGLIMMVMGGGGGWWLVVANDDAGMYA